MATLLIVEDNLPLGRLFSRSLQWDGFIVKHVTSCAAAIKYLNESPVDAILMDMLVADGESYPVIEHVRNHPALKHIPIVAMSGHRAYEAEWRAHQIDLFLYKPVAAMLLPKLFNRLLNRKAEAPQSLSALLA